MQLADYLTKSKTEAELAAVILNLAQSAQQIAQLIRGQTGQKTGTKNSFGEEQLALDVQSDEIIFQELKKVPAVYAAASEETAEEILLNEKGKFIVGFDPLDGSSLVDVNLAVGTIFGIWHSQTLLGEQGANLVAAGFVVYGPRTTLVLASRERPQEFTLQPTGIWELTKQDLQITTGKMFAPGNLRACAENSAYQELVNYWIQERYTLRYSGGMVPDVNQILLKGYGVFTYPQPAKLRLVFECAPLAKIVEAAGGLSSNGQQSILQLSIKALDQRVPVCLGSAPEVERFAKYLDKSN